MTDDLNKRAREYLQSAFDAEGKNRTVGAVARDDAVLSAIRQAILDERERCAGIADKRAREIARIVDEALLTVSDMHDLVWSEYGGPSNLGLLTATAILNNFPTIRTAPADDGWRGIEEAPRGNEHDGPFFDVAWAGEQHRYLPVPARAIDCYREGDQIKRKHGYPSVITIFGPQPTHFLPTPPAKGAK